MATVQEHALPDEVPVIEASDILDGLPAPPGRNETESRGVSLVERCH